MGSGTEPSTVMPATWNPVRFSEPGDRSPRIGFIIGETDTAPERDFHMLLPNDGSVDHFIVRQPNGTAPITPEFLAVFGEDLTALSTALAKDADLDVVVFNCSSAVAVLGYDEIARKIRLARPAVQVVTPLTASVRACRALGVTRISLLVPYEDAVTSLLVEYLAAHGITTLNATSLHVQREQDIARVSPATILEAAVGSIRHDAEAIIISCTDFRAAEITPEIEASIDRPALSSNLCAAWEAMRLCGINSSGKMARLLAAALPDDVQTWNG